MPIKEKEIVTAEEWNKLSNEEKVKRVTEFNRYLEERRNTYPLAPTDWEELVSIARIYQTPIPYKFGIDSEINWGEYK